MGGFKPNKDKHIEGVVSMVLDATQGYRLHRPAHLQRDNDEREEDHD